MTMDINTIAKKIIFNNTYLTLATTNGKNPWASAVFYATDKNYNFYFTSYTDTVHVKNIYKNSFVAFTIFDSHQPAGTGEGLQIAGKAYEVIEKDLPYVIKILYDIRFPDPAERGTIDLSVGRFMKDKKGKCVERIFRIKPTHFYMLDPQIGKDSRIEIMLQ